MSTNLQFAAGEQNVAEVSVSPSVLLFWLKTHLGVSSTRVVTKETNTILGIIPMGSSDHTYPLTNVAGAGVNSKVHVFRGLLGAVLALTGLSSFGDSALGALVLLLLGISMLANTVDATLTLQNNGGGSSVIRVSALEKAKLASFREEINQRLFADHGRLRHEELTNIQNQQLQTQQAQLNAHLLHQQSSTLNQGGSAQSQG